jgi:hypothetical protein
LNTKIFTLNTPADAASELKHGGSYGPEGVENSQVWYRRPLWDVRPTYECSGQICRHAASVKILFIPVFSILYGH